jgi:hypothetical protein
VSTPFTPSNGGKSILTPGSGGDAFSTESNISRMLPRQLSTGSTRGTQTVGYGNVKIDGSNNTITLGDAVGNNLSIGNFSNNSNPASISQGFGVSIVDNDDSFITLGINSSNKSAEMIFNDSKTNRLLIGKNYQNDEVVWISAEGVDVTSADPTQPGQLIFNSNQNIFKIVKTGNSTIPSVVVGSGSSNFSGVTIAHNLGFAPVLNVYANVSTFFVIGGSLTQVNSYVPIPLGNNSAGSFYQLAASGTINNYYLWAGVDTSNLYIGAFFTNTSGGAVSVNIPIKYYLLQETAA